MNPLRLLLNRYKYTGELRNIKILIDTHSANLSVLWGADIVDINPHGIAFSDDTEIPYHRVQLVYYDENVVYSKSEKWAGRYGEE